MMECNKEEANRAKDIALKRMENKDFDGAWKMAIKAQKLYPELENISQMILVCEVHCSAANRVYGNEKDWYGILKIEQTADEVSIKKQYRKMALLLHPDKNRFAGAADAFNLIDVAQSFLTDRQKRSQYDFKCKLAGKTHAPNVGKPPLFQNSGSSHFTSQQRKQPQPATQQWLQNNQTSQIVCPFCSRLIQYYSHATNKILTCPTCKKSFNLIGVKGTQQKYATSQHPSTNASGSSKPFQGNGDSEKAACETPSSGSSKPFQGNGDSEKAAHETPSETRSSANGTKIDSKINGKGHSGTSKRSGKKRKSASESSDSCDILKDDVGDLTGTSFGESRNQYSRRSTRSKQHVSYNENAGDDEDDGEKVKQEGSPCEEILKEQHKEAEIEDEEIGASVDDEKSATEPETYEYPDPEFSDFDKNKKEECFVVGQFWAVYDELDCMPRFYALIKEVLSPGFKVEIAWLEPKPDDEDERRWVAEGLPTSCGKFRLASSDLADNHKMFSHLVHIENRGRKKIIFKIYPRKSETWALFKNWDINWYSDPENHKNNYEFDFVEVLSDYKETTGVYVTLLSKVKGFTCLFRRTNAQESVLIPAKELFRFSHRVPSFQMMGNEGPNVPRGSFELDPACLPTNLVDSEPTEVEKIFSEEEPKPNSKTDAPPKQKPKERSSAAGFTESSSKPEEVTYQNSTVGKKEKNVKPKPSRKGEPVSTKESYVIPDPEFYDFDTEKSVDKFHDGQIWAIYSDEDALPKYYGQIQKIVTRPNFSIHVRWLYSCSTSDDMIRWVDEKIPMGCGIFLVNKREKVHKMNTIEPFSHQLTVVPAAGEKHVFYILPQKGEIWALYKNFDVEMEHSELGNCEYEIVEIAEVNDEWTLGVFLDRVPGYYSVFKPRREKRQVVSVEISKTEILSFSHRIPAFCLTGEQGKNLKGSWELDPAAVPQYLLSSS